VTCAKFLVTFLKLQSRFGENREKVGKNAQKMQNFAALRAETKKWLL